jgi:hypothetical protein
MNESAHFIKKFIICLTLGGIFCNLEYVASESLKQHIHFFKAIGHAIETEDKSNKLLSAEEQLKWLRK